MRGAPFVLCGLVFLTASCEPSQSKIPMSLDDGCYYAGTKPVFKITGTEGRVLIPGEVKTFKVKRSNLIYRKSATFSPAFIFLGYDKSGLPTKVGAYADREPFTFYMKSGTDGPTLEMFNGDFFEPQNVTLGEHC